jgi:hypothetical protein
MSPRLTAVHERKVAEPEFGRFSRHFYASSAAEDPLDGLASTLTSAARRALSSVFLVISKKIEMARDPR